jgi:hypothetical protein
LRRGMSAFGGKADIEIRRRHVRVIPQADHGVERAAR